jgi:serine/threonine protein kinase
MAFNAQHPNFITLRQSLAEHRAPVVFWIGAGVSRDAGLPTWEMLRKHMAEAALEELVTLASADADIMEARLTDAATTSDLWQAFEDIQDILGNPTYKSIVRTRLGPSDTVNIPELHRIIWKQDSVRGVVSLNIDGLEARAHRQERVNEVVDEFIGRDIRNHLPTFKARKPFIARLHGHHSDSSSWVFTKAEISRQVNNDAYRIAINSIFSNFTVIFLGISADDLAAGGFLEAITSAGVDAGNHFWITNRVDRDTRAWSDAAGILRVPYDVGEGETHTGVIKSMFEDISAFKPKDDVGPVLLYPTSSQDHIPSLDQLRTMPEDEVRRNLNAYAKYILDENAHRTDANAYQDFLAAYSPAIHQSWHLSEHQGYNKFFGYTAVEKIHGGPFSSVWRVQDDHYNQYALKIIQIDNLRKGAQLDSFRRGVASQKLLRDLQNFNGIAKIKAAYELPPSVIMEFVEGESMEEIIQKPDFDFWSDGVRVLINLCENVSDAHKSKFGVLHRDIRPQNIMLPNYYYGADAVDHGLDQYAVKLLNYDRAWHKDASGRILATDPRSVGYYAPELLDEPDGSRARDARVDSYGAGMTLYRAASGRNPPVGGSNSTEWQSYLSLIKSPDKIWFKSAHNYLSRLIDSATKVRPVDRPFIGDISAALESLRYAIDQGIESAEPRFLAENLMYALCMDDFEVGSSEKRSSVILMDTEATK